MRPLARTTVVLLTALLAALVALAGLSPAPASADDGDIAWAVRTASNKFGADRQNYSYTVAAGGTVRDGIVVTNHGDQPLDLAVYAADGFTTAQGQLDLLTRDKESTGVGAWVHASRDAVHLKPEQTVTVPFTVDVPDNATPGDHMGGIITSLSEPGTAGGMNVDRRLAIRIRLRVGGDLKPALSVEGPDVSYGGSANPFATGTATVDYTIHNTGNAILAAGQQVSVSGPFGAFRVDAADVPDTPELLPGESWTVSVPVDGVRPAVSLAATVSLTPMLTDASGSTTPLDAVDATGHAWTLPWGLLLLLVAVVVAAVAAVLVLRRRRAAARKREDARVQDAVEQALRERETSTRT